MKAFVVIIVSSFFTISTWAQDYPDSASPDDSAGRGFTNKAEAKNLLVNGLKEGKWVEYTNRTGRIVKTDEGFYRLTVYKADEPYGIVRDYVNTDNGGHLLIETSYKNGKLNGLRKEYTITGQVDKETPFVDGRINGVVKEYYDTGVENIMNRHSTVIKTIHHSKITTKYEYSYSNDILNGICKDYYENGILKRETIYKKGEVVTSKTYDENGNEIK